MSKKYPPISAVNTQVRDIELEIDNILSDLRYCRTKRHLESWLSRNAIKTKEGTLLNLFIDPIQECADNMQYIPFEDEPQP